jgi:inosine-uridine nucleoside N-ribohydrolase
MQSLAVIAMLSLCALGLLGDASMAAEKIPVIFDTDIGDDIDDTWALVMLLKSPQLDVKLITTTCGKAEYRAKLIAKMLTVAKRTDIPIGLGAGGTSGHGGQQEWVADYKLADYPGKVHQDGVAAVIETIEKSSQSITVISVGPLHTMGEVLQRRPDIAGKAQFVGMHGSVRIGYGGKKTPDAEYNVRANVQACRRVLSAPRKKTTITPLDTCGLVNLSGERFLKLRQSKDPLVQALMENYRIWAKKTQLEELTASSTLFDTVAIYLAYPGERPLVEFEQLKIVVTDDGHTRIDDSGTPMLVAARWKDLDGFRDLLVNVLIGQ